MPGTAVRPVRRVEHRDAVAECRTITSAQRGTKNPPQGYGAVASARMDFREYDRIDEDALNRILWHSIKGENVAYPAPVRRALPTPLGLFRFPKEVE